MAVRTTFLTVLSGLVFVIGLGPVSAKEFIVKEENENFSELYLRVENKDAVKFINLDSVNHKLTFVHKELTQTFNLMSPGTSQVVEFARPGIYDITCSIHSNMKLTVFVPFSISANN